MKAYRVYHIDSRFHADGTKVYSCNSPGYWSHHCVDPEYAIPFLSKEKAESFARTEEEFVSPSGETRYVEEYEETRQLVVNKYNGNVVLAQFMPYYTDRCCYIPA